jgi:stage III sporulation protein AE
MIFLSTVLSIVNNISEKVQLSRLAALLKQISLWALGLILTVFVAIVSVQGSLGAVIDGVASKTAKYALGAFIPVAGKYLADAADTVLGCTLLIKNAAGLAVMIGIIAICLVPFLKIAAIVALYKLTCAAIEPIADKRITACLTDVSNSMLFILGITGAIAVMFLISITVLISAGNLSSMIR